MNQDMMTTANYMSASTIEAHLYHAEIWLDSIDRSTLGKLSNNIDLMTIIYALTAARFSTYSKDNAGDGWAVNIDEVFSEKLDDYNLKHNQPFLTDDEIVALYGETFFWLELLQPHNKALMQWLQEKRNQGIDESVMYYRFIHNNYGGLAYFEVGIWDLEFINRCLTDDIDPSIALELMPPEEAPSIIQW